MYLSLQAICIFIASNKRTPHHENIHNNNSIAVIEHLLYARHYSPYTMYVTSFNHHSILRRWGYHLSDIVCQVPSRQYMHLPFIDISQDFSTRFDAWWFRPKMSSKCLMCWRMKESQSATLISEFIHWRIQQLNVVLEGGAWLELGCWGQVMENSILVPRSFLLCLLPGCHHGLELSSAMSFCYPVSEVQPDDHGLKIWAKINLSSLNRVRDFVPLIGSD